VPICSRPGYNLFLYSTGRRKPQLALSFPDQSDSRRLSNPIEDTQHEGTHQHRLCVILPGKVQVDVIPSLDLLLATISKDASLSCTEKYHLARKAYIPAFLATVARTLAVVTRVLRKRGGCKSHQHGGYGPARILPPFGKLARARPAPDCSTRRSCTEISGIVRQTST